MVPAHPRSANRFLRQEPRSDELVGAQVIVRLDDLAQFVFRRTIAAIGVRMMPLDQVLVTRLDLRLGGVAGEVKRHQRFDRQRVVPRRRLVLRRLAARSAPSRRAGLGKNGFVDLAAGRGSPGAKLPGWPVADRVGLAKFRHRSVVHAAEVIVGGVIFPYMIAAEAEIFALALAALGRAEYALSRAAGKGTGGPRGLFRRA